LAAAEAQAAAEEASIDEELAQGEALAESGSSAEEGQIIYGWHTPTSSRSYKEAASKKGAAFLLQLREARIRQGVDLSHAIGKHDPRSGESLLLREPSFTRFLAFPVASSGV